MQSLRKKKKEIEKKNPDEIIWDRKEHSEV